MSISNIWNIEGVNNSKSSQDSTKKQDWAERAGQSQIELIDQNIKKARASSRNINNKQSRKSSKSPLKIDVRPALDQLNGSKSKITISVKESHLKSP